MTEETTPPIELNEEPTNTPTIPEPIEKFKKPSKKRVRETPPPAIKRVYNERYKMGILAEKLVEKLKPELKPDVKQEVKGEQQSSVTLDSSRDKPQPQPQPLPEQMKVNIKQSPISCPKSNDDDHLRDRDAPGPNFKKYDEERVLGKYKKMKLKFNALSEEMQKIKSSIDSGKPRINPAIYNHLFSRQ